VNILSSVGSDPSLTGLFKSAAGKIGDNIVAAQALVAYLSRNPEGLNHMEHVIGNNDMVKILSGNIESCLDAFPEVDTLSSSNEVSRRVNQRVLVMSN
jgi:hypothetical protein